MTQSVDVNSTAATIDVAPVTERSTDIAEVVTTIVVDGDSGNQLVSIDSPAYSIETSNSTPLSIEAGSTKHDIHVGDDAGTGPVAAHTHTVISNDLTVVGDFAATNVTAVGDVDATNVTAVGDVDATNVTAVGDVDAASLTGDVQRLRSTDDVTLSSTTHAFQIGADDGYNIAMDTNELQARNNGVGSLLGLNLEGGVVVFGGNIYGVDGTVAAPGYTFDLDPDLGITRVSPNVMAVSANGKEMIQYSWAYGGFRLFQDGDTSDYCTFDVNETSMNFRTTQPDFYFDKTVKSAGQYVGNGSSAGYPTYSFTGNVTTGMYLYAANTIGWSAGGYQMMAMDTAGTYFYDHSNTANWMNVHVDGNWGRLTTSEAWIYFNKGLRVDTGIVSSYDEPLYLAVDGNTMAYLNNDNNTAGMTVYNNYASPVGQGAHAGILVRTKNSQAISGEVAGISMWTQYSTDRHVHQRVYYATGDAITYRNWENTAWASLQASSFAVQSTIKSKDRVRTARDERGLLDFAVAGPRKMAFAQHRKVRPVLFDNKHGEFLTEWAGCTGHSVRDYANEDPADERDKKWTEPVFHETREECQEADCKGGDNTRRIQHHCDDYECGGTKERPCDLVSRHVNRVGLIAEEIEEIWPRAVTQDMFGEEKGIDYSVIVTELLNTVTHMLEDRDEMRDRAAAAIIARRSAEKRLDALEAQVAELMSERTDERKK